jgi:GTPase involved in cell partitioning and DNA repair
VVAKPPAFFFWAAGKLRRPYRGRPGRQEVLFDQFADEASISCRRKGRGWMRRVSVGDKYVPRGGTVPGDGGGREAVSFFEVREISDAGHLRYQQTFRRARGTDGTAGTCTAPTGADIVIPIPPGHLVKDRSRAGLRDFTEDTDDGFS